LLNQEITKLETTGFGRANLSVTKSYSVSMASSTMSRMSSIRNKVASVIDYKYLLAGWGMPIGVMFDLEEMAISVKKTNGGRSL